jgi:YD repeat-containing protein
MVIMKPRNSLAYILAVLITLPLVGTVAPAATIKVLKTFDYPGDGNSTLPQKISDQGVVIGSVIDINEVVTGFFYKFRLGKFSAPVVEPNDTGNLTQGRGINNKRHACGEYLNGSDGTFHGYVLEHPDFIEFDITDALDTIPLGINNAGDFVGTVVFSDGTQPGFINSLGNVITFEVPDATATLAYQINTTHQVIGYYIDANGITHGYTRDGDGNLTFPIDVAGSTGTILFGNNDSNWGVGRYTDMSGATHGLFFITPDDILTFDYPGSTFTSLNGINKAGFICGYYLDAAGIFHGFVALLKPDAASQPTTNGPMAPVKPAHPLPEMLRIGAAPAL